MIPYHVPDLAKMLYDNGLREALIRRVRHGATRAQVKRLAKFMGVPAHELHSDAKGAIVRRL